MANHNSVNSEGEPVVALKARLIDVSTGVHVVILNEDEAREMDISPMDRVRVEHDGQELVCMVDVSGSMIKRGEIGLFADVTERIKAKKDELVHVRHSVPPNSIELIRKKMDGGRLTEKDVDTIVEEIIESRLSDSELASLMASIYIRGLNSEETVALTNAIVHSGETLDIGAHPVVDKHCTGGVAGNRTTMILVPIVAAAGLYIPKTSSRSITSASGTADTMEVLANISFELEEMKRIVKKTHGCIVWGGAMNLAAADDVLIRIRHPLRLDPLGVMVASVLAKKKSVGAEYVVIDIPVGRGGKIEEMAKANALANEFINISAKLGMKAEVFITSGRDPVGEGIGPALECRDVLNTLQGHGPSDLTEKSCKLAGAVLEICGKVEPGRGYDVAINLLKNGKAYDKMMQIIDAQGGNPSIRADDIPIGHYKYEVRAESDARVHLVDNRAVNKVARIAGAPKSKGAGMLLHVESGDRVKKGQLLFEVISESETKLTHAIDALHHLPPIEFQKVILGKMGEEGIFEWKPKGT